MAKLGRNDPRAGRVLWELTFEGPMRPMGRDAPDDAAQSLLHAIVESASDYAMITTDLEGRITSWSRGAQNVLGWTDAEVLDKPVDLIFTQEDRAAKAPAAEQAEALRSGRATDERWHLRKDGSRFWASGELMPLRHEGVKGFLKILRDRTGEREALEALQRSETLKIAVLEAALDGIITIDESSRVLEWNAAAERTFGYAREMVIDRDLADLIIPPELREQHRQGMARYLRTGSGPLLGRRVEVEAIRADGSRFPVELAISPIRLEGKPHFTARLRDISDRKRAEAALRESEARFRHLADSAPALIWLTDQNGRLTFANMHFDYVFGRPAASFIPKGWRNLVHRDDLSGFTTEFMRAFQARRAFKMEVRIFDKNAQIRWVRAEGVPRLDDAGLFLGYTGVALDITDAKVAHEHQTLLLNELNHRVKNTLATVQSIVAQTLRRAASSAQARRDIDARLVALSRAHDVLTRENWEGANLREIVFQAVEPFETEGGRFRLDGPELRLPPRLSLGIAMALQELATNAVKYGALSNDLGQVRVAWSQEAAGGLPGLKLVWSEKGGPPVTAPRHRGFGTTLIERTFDSDAGGAATLKFEPSGLICEISLSGDRMDREREMSGADGEDAAWVRASREA